MTDFVAGGQVLAAAVARVAVELGGLPAGTLLAPLPS
jgi:hypothetical protein